MVGPTLGGRLLAVHVSCAVGAHVVLAALPLTLAVHLMGSVRTVEGGREWVHLYGWAWARVRVKSTPLL